MILMIVSNHTIIREIHISKNVWYFVHGCTIITYVYGFGSIVNHVIK